MIRTHVAATKSGTEIRAEGPLSSAQEEAAGPRPVGTSLRAYLASSRTAVVGVALSVFAMFIPVATVPYAQTDDYALLWMAISGRSDPQVGRSIFDANAVQGRPLQGLLDSWLFSAAGSIDNLRFLRVLAVVAIAAFGVLLHWTLVRSGFRSAFAALIAVLICSLPAFQVYGAWAVLFSTP